MGSSTSELKARRREDYLFHLDYRTRWNDNDMYDHMNNSIYNFLFDSIVNSYLITHCDLHPPSSSQYGLVVHTHTNYFASIAFPAIADLALRVNKLGRSSVTYEVALFERGIDEVKAVGEFVHVFVDRETGKPAKSGMGEVLRRGLEKLVVEGTHVGVESETETKSSTMGAKL
ncbi:HotDog domain-containing protein [Mariannaea sp. PMI_226]|nr:HotDog domain-containing protein [Mariannaea sp. PMI_226]